MARWAAFLRGMNLGGRRVRNDELVTAFESLKFSSVAAFLASGNLVFDTAIEDSSTLEAKIEGGLKEALGYDVPTFLRRRAEVLAITGFEAFPPDVLEGSEGKLQVGLLQTEPSNAARSEALSLGSEEDRLRIDGRELYWLPAGGFLESKLDLKRLEALLGSWTTRTSRTIERLAAKFFAS